MEEKRYLYWSIQSSQSLEPTEQELELFQNKYKEDYEQDVVYEGEELLQKFRLNGFRNPLFSQITSIILAFENGGEMRVKYITGNEADLLQNFVNLLRNSFQDYTLVNFNSEILLPFLGVRLHKQNFINTAHPNLKYQGGIRSWNFTGVDLKAYYQGGGKYSFSLKEIAYILNIDSEGIINHRDEFNYVNSGDEEVLKKSAIKQVEVMAEIWRKLNELPKLETVLVEERVEDVVAEAPKDWLKELYNANQFTNEIREGLKQQIFGGKKKPTKKELEQLFTIIRGVYVLTDFENKRQDSKATIELKEKEIKLFLGL